MTTKITKILVLTQGLMVMSFVCKTQQAFPLIVLGNQQWESEHARGWMDLWDTWPYYHMALRDADVQVFVYQVSYPKLW